MFENVDYGWNLFVSLGQISEGSGNRRLDTKKFMIGQTIQFLPISAIQIYYKLEFKRILKISFEIFQLDIDRDSALLGRVHFWFEIQQFFHYKARTTHVFTRPWDRTQTALQDRPRHPPRDPRTIAPPRGSQPRGARCPCGPCR